MKPFNEADAKPGDPLALARDPDRLLRFKGMGFDGFLIAAWVNPQDHRFDAMLRPLDVLIVDPS